MPGTVPPRTDGSRPARRPARADAPGVHQIERSDPQVDNSGDMAESSVCFTFFRTVDIVVEFTHAGD
jgi:hypothetical protein